MRKNRRLDAHTWKWTCNVMCRPGGYLDAKSGARLSRRPRWESKRGEQERPIEGGTGDKNDGKEGWTTQNHTQGPAKVKPRVYHKKKNGGRVFNAKGHRIKSHNVSHKVVLLAGDLSRSKMCWGGGGPIWKGGRRWDTPERLASESSSKENNEEGKQIYNTKSHRLIPGVGKEDKVPERTAAIHPYNGRLATILSVKSHLGNVKGKREEKILA